MPTSLRLPDPLDFMGDRKINGASLALHSRQGDRWPPDPRKGIQPVRIKCSPLSSRAGARKQLKGCQTGSPARAHLTSRRAIVEELSHGPISVSRLAELLGFTLAAVVQHLQVLEESGLVQTAKLGRVRTCRIEPGRARRGGEIEGRLDRLGDLLAQPEECE